MINIQAFQRLALSVIMSGIVTGVAMKNDLSFMGQLLAIRLHWEQQSCAMASSWRLQEGPLVTSIYQKRGGLGLVRHFGCNAAMMSRNGPRHLAAETGPFHYSHCAAWGKFRRDQLQGHTRVHVALQAGHQTTPNFLGRMMRERQRYALTLESPIPAAKAASLCGSTEGFTCLLLPPAAASASVL